MSIHHPIVVVLSQDCDLLWDFQARFATDDAQAAYEPESADIDSHRSCVSHVIACDAYSYDELRDRVPGSDVMRRIKNNQDERYHALVGDAIGPRTSKDDQPAPIHLYLDFKKALALPTRQLYGGVRSGGVRRIAVVPPVFVHDLIHRFYGYHSRVALPVP